MKLTLSLRTSPPPEGVDPERVLQEGSMTIGRAPEATWTIPDPARVISKQHCRIDAASDGFTITDISTNGAYLNEQPVGRESARRLSDGDVVRMGNVVIAARIDDEERTVASPVIPMDDGPFGENETAAAPKPDAAIPSPNVAGPIAEDWWKESPAAAGKNSADHSGPGSSLPVADAIVIGLVDGFPGLDVATLAQGIDAAGAVIGDKEWRAFYDRLQAYLRERYPENA